MTSPPKKSLVLVVGAGGSKEVGLPLGSELKSAISTALDIRYEYGRQRVSGDEMIDAAFQILAWKLPEPRTGVTERFLESARRVARAMPQSISIDNFIDSHRGDEDIARCGKLAIVRTILAAEMRSKLYVDRRNNDNLLHFGDVENTWFNAFFQLLTENCHRDELGDRLSKVAIVTFNYDRCIEHYLYLGLQNYYGISPQEAKENLNMLAIYHPYGTVGHLEWQSQGGISFGGDLDADRLLRFANNIRTFTEGIDPTLGESDTVRTVVAQARRLVFLGFAFHKLNIELLFQGPPFAEDARQCPVYATSKGLSKADVALIGEQICERANIRKESLNLLNPLTCAELLREYWRGLSLS